MTRTTATEPFADSAIPLVEDLGPARLSVYLTAERYRVARQAPPIGTLVLSGGGAGGEAYAAAIQALTALRVMSGIQEIRGTSVGAMVGALVACGMSADELSALTARLVLPGVRLKKGDPLCMPSWMEWFTRLFGLFSTGKPLREFVYKYGRMALLARMEAWLATADTRDAGYQVVLQLRRELVELNQPLTFGRLAQASQWLPMVKAFACSVFFQGCHDQPPAMRILSAETTPDLEIARAVQASSALPLLRRWVRLKLLSKYDKARAVYFDGGCTLNTPARAVLEPASLAGLPVLDELVLVFEPASRRTGFARWCGWLFDWFNGIETAVNTVWLRHRLALPTLSRNVVQIPRLPQGDETRATMPLNGRRKEKIWLQQSARWAIERYVHQRRSMRVTREYRSLSCALLALDEENFTRLARHGLGGGMPAETLERVFSFRQRTDEILYELRRLSLEETTFAEGGECEPIVQNYLSRLSALLVEEGSAYGRFDLARLYYVLDRFVSPDYRLVRRVLDLSLMRAPASRSRLETAWLLHQEKQVVQILVYEIQRQLLYPAFYTYRQSSVNQDLLWQAIRRLPHLLTLRALQEALDCLLRHYRPNWFGSFGVYTVRRQIRRWLKEIRYLRQGRGCVWQGVTAFAQQADDGSDRPPLRRS